MNHRQDFAPTGADEWAAMGVLMLVGLIVLPICVLARRLTRVMALKAPIALLVGLAGLSGCSRNTPSVATSEPALMRTAGHSTLTMTDNVIIGSARVLVQEGQSTVHASGNVFVQDSALPASDHPDPPQNPENQIGTVVGNQGVITQGQNGDNEPATAP